MADAGPASAGLALLPPVATAVPMVALDRPARRIDAPTRVVVAGRAVGGAIGSLIAIHDVVAALTAVGLVGREGRVIRLELIPVAQGSRRAC